MNGHEQFALQDHGTMGIRAGTLPSGQPLPLVVEPKGTLSDPDQWAVEHKDSVTRWLYDHGAVLFRGFPLGGVDGFRRFAHSLAGRLLTYQERSSPRTQIGDNIYTSTEYPSDQTIFLHNENSYQSAWPMKLFFYCHTACNIGGETPIADCRRIFARIPAAIKEKFMALGIMYVRCFTKSSNVTWREVFGTDDRAAVEEKCREWHIQPEWMSEDALRTRAVRPLVWKHPVIGVETWFNHATFFHVTTLEPVIRQALEAEYGEDELPRNSFYGDGSPIEPDVVRQLREIYQDEKTMFTWKQGDLLLIDNMLTAHGREPYFGDRKILVAMAEPCKAPL